MNIETLVDKKLGLIKVVNRLSNLLEEPKDLFIYSALINDISQYLNWRPDLVGSGASFSKKGAFNAAVGELVERYCGNFVPNQLDRKNIAEMNNENFLNPNIMYQFTNEQFNTKGFPFSLYENDEEIEWVYGLSLTDNKKYWIPAEFVFLNYSLYRKQIYKQRPILLSGIAAGEGVTNATISALLEIIERDTTMLWWIGRQSQTKIIVNKNSEIYKKIMQRLHYSLKIEWYLLPSDFKVYTVACLLMDYKNHIYTVGFASRFNAELSLEKSAAEAFQLRRFSLDLLNIESPIWKNPNYQNILGLKRYRKDRKYSQSFASDWSNMTSLLHNVQYFLDKSAWENAKKRFISHKCVELRNLRLIKAANKIKYLINEFKQNSLSAHLVDVTTEDIKQTGLTVVRAISPEACPNMPTAFPMLANKRLLKVAERNKGVMKDEVFDLSPLPHS
jgi:ribosomal protein S12 methylthiotransferase accessory factor